VTHAFFPSFRDFVQLAVYVKPFVSFALTEVNMDEKNGNHAQFTLYGNNLPDVHPRARPAAEKMIS
jgi:hypothetical protein